METLPLSFASGRRSGFSAYLVILVVGIVGRTDWADAPGVFQRTDVERPLACGDSIVGMDTRKLGPFEVYPIGLGAMPFSMGDNERPSEEQAVATVHAALDAGVTYLDTADIYAPSWDTVGHNNGSWLVRWPRTAGRPKGWSSGPRAVSLAVLVRRGLGTVPSSICAPPSRPR